MRRELFVRLGVPNLIPIATIGFTKTSAERFFQRLRDAEVAKLVDVRLHNTSQLSGFAKADDLTYFLQAIAGISYTHMPILAPTDEMLKDYKKLKGAWSVYEDRFFRLMAERKIEKVLEPNFFRHACLLCSEAKPHHCHRRIVCDYLNAKWDGALSVRHL
jgi:uncharacterized protein (DUF488 family)